MNYKKDDYYYFKGRTPDKIFVSKVFPSIFTSEKRFVRKVFDKKNTSEFVEVNGEIILKGSLLGKYQVEAIVYSHMETTLMEFVLQKFIPYEDNTIPVKEISFSFSQDEFTELLKFLSDVKFIDFTNKEKFIVDCDSLPNSKIVLNLTKPNPNQISVDKNLGELVNKLALLKDNEKESILESLKNNGLTKNDLDILSGRKDGLKEFKRNMNDTSKLDEIEWQRFFKQNNWIFGYGLDYRFLSILQKEASVSSIDLNGKNEVKSDFILATNNFTVIVELKRPDTLLFEKDKNRSESWKLSKDLTYAVSQILTQKAEWEINSGYKNFDENDEPITQTTIDPKSILIIGHSEQFNGKNKVDLIKRKTFELYRRNSRNIEIITYDELLERAKFIVNDNNSEIESFQNDDLPF